MRKTIGIFLLIFSFFFLAGSVFADIGENFAAAGTSIGGNVSFYYDAGYVFSGYDTSTYLSLSVNPSIGFMLIDNFEFDLSPGLNFSSSTDYDGQVTKNLSVGIDTNFRYYFYGGSSFVPAIGTGLSFYVRPSLSGGDTWLTIGFDPNFRLYYFVKERISPYIGIYPSFNYWINPEVSIPFANSVSFQIRTTIGITFWIPNKDAVISPKATK